MSQIRKVAKHMKKQSSKIIENIQIRKTHNQSQKIAKITKFAKQKLQK